MSDKTESHSIRLFPTLKNKSSLDNVYDELAVMGADKRESAFYLPDARFFFHNEILVYQTEGVAVAFPKKYQYVVMEKSPNSGEVAYSLAFCDEKQNRLAPLTFKEVTNEEELNLDELTKQAESSDVPITNDLRKLRKINIFSVLRDIELQLKDENHIIPDRVATKILHIKPWHDNSATPGQAALYLEDDATKEIALLPQDKVSFRVTKDDIALVYAPPIGAPEHTMPLSLKDIYQSERLLKYIEDALDTHHIYLLIHNKNHKISDSLSDISDGKKNTFEKVFDHNKIASLLAQVNLIDREQDFPDSTTMVEGRYALELGITNKLLEPTSSNSSQQAYRMSIHTDEEYITLERNTNAPYKTIVYANNNIGYATVTDNAKVGSHEDEVIPMRMGILQAIAEDHFMYEHQAAAPSLPDHTPGSNYGTIYLKHNDNTPGQDEEQLPLSIRVESMSLARSASWPLPSTYIEDQRPMQTSWISSEQTAETLPEHTQPTPALAASGNVQSHYGADTGNTLHRLFEGASANENEQGVRHEPFHQFWETAQKLTTSPSKPHAEQPSKTIPTQHIDVSNGKSHGAGTKAEEQAPITGTDQAGAEHAGPVAPNVPSTLQDSENGAAEENGKAAKNQNKPYVDEREFVAAGPVRNGAETNLPMGHITNQSTQHVAPTVSPSNLPHNSGNSAKTDGIATTGDKGQLVPPTESNSSTRTKEHEPAANPPTAVVITSEKAAPSTDTKQPVSVHQNREAPTGRSLRTQQDSDNIIEESSWNGRFPVTSDGKKSHIQPSPATQELAIAFQGRGRATTSAEVNSQAAQHNQNTENHTQEIAGQKTSGNQGVTLQLELPSNQHAALVDHSSSMQQHASAKTKNQQRTEDTMPIDEINKQTSADTDQNADPTCELISKNSSKLDAPQEISEHLKALQPLGLLVPGPMIRTHRINATDPDAYVATIQTATQGEIFLPKHRYYFKDGQLVCDTEGASYYIVIPKEYHFLRQPPQTTTQHEVGELCDKEGNALTVQSLQVVLKDDPNATMVPYQNKFPGVKSLSEIAYASWKAAPGVEKLDSSDTDSDADKEFSKHPEVKIVEREQIAVIERLSDGKTLGKLNDQAAAFSIAEPDSGYPYKLSLNGKDFPVQGLSVAPLSTQNVKLLLMSDGNLKLFDNLNTEHTAYMVFTESKAEEFLSAINDIVGNRPTTAQPMVAQIGFEPKNKEVGNYNLRILGGTGWLDTSALSKKNIYFSTKLSGIVIREDGVNSHEKLLAFLNPLVETHGLHKGMPMAVSPQCEPHVYALTLGDKVISANFGSSYIPKGDEHAPKMENAEPIAHESGASDTHTYDGSQPEMPSETTSTEVSGSQGTAHDVDVALSPTIKSDGPYGVATSVLPSHSNAIQYDERATIEKLKDVEPLGVLTPGAIYNNMPKLSREAPDIYLANIQKNISTTPFLDPHRYYFEGDKLICDTEGAAYYIVIPKEYHYLRQSDNYGNHHYTWEFCDVDGNALTTESLHVVRKGNPATIMESYAQVLPKVDKLAPIASVEWKESTGVPLRPYSAHGPAPIKIIAEKETAALKLIASDETIGKLNDQAATFSIEQHNGVGSYKLHLNGVEIPLNVENPIQPYDNSLSGNLQLVILNGTLLIFPPDKHFPETFIVDSVEKALTFRNAIEEILSNGHSKLEKPLVARASLEFRDATDDQHENFDLEIVHNGETLCPLSFNKELYFSTKLLGLISKDSSDAHEATKEQLLAFLNVFPSANGKPPKGLPIVKSSPCHPEAFALILDDSKLLGIDLSKHNISSNNTCAQHLDLVDTHASKKSETPEQPVQNTEQKSASHISNTRPGTTSTEGSVTEEPTNTQNSVLDHINNEVDTSGKVETPTLEDNGQSPVEANHIPPLEESVLTVHPLSTGGHVSHSNAHSAGENSGSQDNNESNYVPVDAATSGQVSNKMSQAIPAIADIGHGEAFIEDLEHGSSKIRPNTGNAVPIVLEEVLSDTDICKLISQNDILTNNKQILDRLKTWPNLGVLAPGIAINTSKFSSEEPYIYTASVQGYSGEEPFIPIYRYYFKNDMLLCDTEGSAYHIVIPEEYHYLKQSSQHFGNRHHLGEFCNIEGNALTTNSLHVIRKDDPSAALVSYEALLPNAQKLPQLVFVEWTPIGKEELELQKDNGQTSQYPSVEICAQGQSAMLKRIVGGETIGKLNDQAATFTLESQDPVNPYRLLLNGKEFTIKGSGLPYHKMPSVMLLAISDGILKIYSDTDKHIPNAKVVESESDAELLNAAINYVLQYGSTKLQNMVAKVALETRGDSPQNFDLRFVQGGKLLRNLLCTEKELYFSTKLAGLAIRDSHGQCEERLVAFLNSLSTPENNVLEGLPMVKSSPCNPALLALTLGDKVLTADFNRSYLSEDNTQKEDQPTAEVHTSSAPEENTQQGKNNVAVASTPKNDTKTEQTTDVTAELKLELGRIIGANHVPGKTLYSAQGLLLHNAADPNAIKTVALPVPTYISTHKGVLLTQNDQNFSLELAPHHRYLLILKDADGHKLLPCNAEGVPLNGDNFAEAPQYCNDSEGCSIFQDGKQSHYSYYNSTDYSKNLAIGINYLSTENNFLEEFYETSRKSGKKPILQLSDHGHFTPAPQLKPVGTEHTDTRHSVTITKPSIMFAVRNDNKAFDVIVTSKDGRFHTTQVDLAGKENLEGLQEARKATLDREPLYLISDGKTVLFSTNPHSMKPVNTLNPQTKAVLSAVFGFEKSQQSPQLHDGNFSAFRVIPIEKYGHGLQGIGIKMQDSIIEIPLTNSQKNGHIWGFSVSDPCRIEHVLKDSHKIVQQHAVPKLQREVLKEFISDNVKLVFKHRDAVSVPDMDVHVGKHAIVKYDGTAYDIANVNASQEAEDFEQEFLQALHNQEQIGSSDGAVEKLPITQLDAMPLTQTSAPSLSTKSYMTLHGRPVETENNNYDSHFCLNIDAKSPGTALHRLPRSVFYFQDNDKLTVITPEHGNVTFDEKYRFLKVKQGAHDNEFFLALCDSNGNTVKSAPLIDIRDVLFDIPLGKSSPLDLYKSSVGKVIFEIQQGYKENSYSRTRAELLPTFENPLHSTYNDYALAHLGTVGIYLNWETYDGKITLQYLNPIAMAGTYPALEINLLEDGWRQAPKVAMEAKSKTTPLYLTISNDKTAFTTYKNVKDSDMRHDEAFMQFLKTVLVFPEDGSKTTLELTLDAPLKEAAHDIPFTITPLEGGASLIDPEYKFTAKRLYFDLGNFYITHEASKSVNALAQPTKWAEQMIVSIVPVAFKLELPENGTKDQLKLVNRFNQKSISVGELNDKIVQDLRFYDTQTNGEYGHYSSAPTDNISQDYHSTSRRNAPDDDLSSPTETGLSTWQSSVDTHEQKQQEDILGYEHGMRQHSARSIKDTGNYERDGKNLNHSDNQNGHSSFNFEEWSLENKRHKLLVDQPTDEHKHSLWVQATEAEIRTFYENVDVKFRSNGLSYHEAMNLYEGIVVESCGKGMFPVQLGTVSDDGNVRIGTHDYGSLADLDKMFSPA